MDVSGGYPRDLDYIKLAFNSLSPASLKLLLNLSGYRAPDINGPFTYAELGSGFGVSIAGWAAQYPQAVFHAIDYNRNQAAWSRALADKAGLTNLHVHGLSIHDVKELPTFDFIVAHGLYSWVSDEVRAEIRRFVTALLKPGGCFYVSYNAMPGFKDFEPMRHLIMHEVRNCVADDPLGGVKSGIDLLVRLMEGGAAYFKESPQAQKRLNQWLVENPNYLGAELLAETHRAYYFNDLANELEGLHWAGWAGMIDYLAAQAAPAALVDLLAGKDLLMIETIRDFFYNKMFRTDLFVSATADKATFRQKQPLYAELLETSFSLALLRKPLPRSASRHNFEADLSASIYRLIQSALASGPQTVARLAEVLQFSLPEIVEGLCVLTALDWVQPGPLQNVAGQTARLRHFNNTLAGQCGEDILMPILSAHGGWIKPEEQVEHLAIPARLRGEPVEDCLCRILSSDEPEMPLSEAAALRQSIRRYLESADKGISLFLRRHGLTD